MNALLVEKCSLYTLILALTHGRRVLKYPPCQPESHTRPVRHASLEIDAHTVEPTRPDGWSVKDTRMETNPAWTISPKDSK